MTTKRAASVAGLVFALAALSGSAWANDNLVSTVSIPAGQPVPVIEVNGVAQGNIRLTYTVVGSTFPCGTFAQFNLGLVDQAGAGHAGVYPSDLSLAQSGGGTPVQLSPSPGTLTVNGIGWSGSSLVTVSIDCSKVPALPADGYVIDGQMNEMIDGSRHINTISSVQVHIKLVLPTACLKLYSFESDQDTGDLLTSVTVNSSRGTIRSTNPGQVSVDALVVNTCGITQTFNLLMGLDPLWQTNPQGNPGNATFTYTTAGEFDPNTFNLAAFGAGTPQGQSLCLNNISLAANDSFLARVHTGIGNFAVSSLPSDGDFDFNATLFVPGACSGTLLSGVDPSNPATSKLAFTIH
jgi:hypothetical protein